MNLASSFSVSARVATKLVGGGVPGGRVEPGEKLEDTARRELVEEVGITADELEYLGFVKDFQGERDFIHVIFACRKWQGEVTNVEPDECEGWEWYDIEKLPEKILVGHEAGIKLLKTHQKYIEVTS